MNDVTDSFIEVELPTPDSFLLVKESLTRIGIQTFNPQKTLIQSCHILQKKNHYYLVHFLEMFGLDGLPSHLEESDIKRRNTIASLLEQWQLLKILNPDILAEFGFCDLSELRILTFTDKKNWILKSNYTMGKFKKN